METTMTTGKNNLCLPGATAPGSGTRRVVAWREWEFCFYNFLVVSNNQNAD
jgi:hypothetical protein